MQLRKSLICILIFLCLVPVSLGSAASQFKDALLKQEVSSAILRECGSLRASVAHQLKANLKRALHQGTPKMRNELSPDPEYVKALAKAVCSTGNYRAAELSLLEGNLKSSLEYQYEEPISQDAADIVDVEIAKSDSGDRAQSYPFSFSPLLSFVLGLFFGSVITHYFLLLKRTPDSTGSKSIRRPEL